MVARLVADALWRNRWLYAASGVCLVPSWLLLGMITRPNPLPIGSTAISLIFAAVLGPMVVIATMTLRALRHLPVTARDLWRAMWILATLVPAALLLSTKAVSALLVAASGDSPQLSAEAMLLSALYDASWTGVVLPVCAALGYAGHGVARSGATATSLRRAGPMVVMLGCFQLPILVSDALPSRVGEFTSVSMGVLVACLTIAAGSLAWTPRQRVLAGEGVDGQRAARPGVSARTRQIDRLTGVWRVAVPGLLATLAVAIGSCLALAVYGVVSGSGPWWFVPQTKDLFDPQDIGDRGLTFVVLAPSFVAIVPGCWTQWARLLKVLPLSARQITALFLLTPLATWALLWLVGVSVYALAYGAPPTLRVDLAFGLAGVAALMQAVMLRFQGSIGLIWIVILVSALWPQLMKVGLSDATAAHRMFAVIGAVAFFAAGFVNHRTLTRSTSSSPAYRLPVMSFKTTR
jgi:hypothetical protein